jgi:hypothetical protein
LQDCTHAMANGRSYIELYSKQCVLLCLALTGCLSQREPTLSNTLDSGDWASVYERLQMTPTDLQADDLNSILRAAIAKEVDQPTLEKILPALIQHGVNINEADEAGNMPLLLAISAGRENAVRVLLSEGSDPNKGNVHSNVTPLHFSFDFNHEFAVPILISNGANVNLRDSMGRLPIHAASLRASSLVNRLIAQDPSCSNAEDDFGLTPLFYATMSRSGRAARMVVIRQLIFGGANANQLYSGCGIPDSTVGYRTALQGPRLGESVVEYASRIGETTIADVLREAKVAGE